MFKNLEAGVRLGIGLGLVIILLFAMPVVNALHGGGFGADINDRGADRFPLSVLAKDIIAPPTESMNKSNREASAMIQSGQRLIFALYGAAFLIALSLACWIDRSLTRPVAEPPTDVATRVDGSLASPDAGTSEMTATA